MRDVTNIVLAQSKEYGRRPKLDVTRVDNYVFKVQRIYRILHKETMLVLVISGKTIRMNKYMEAVAAVGIVRALGKDFFLEIFHSNDGTTMKIVVKEPVDKDLGNDEQEYLLDSACMDHSDEYSTG